jgi:hypothetical protein
MISSQRSLLCGIAVFYCTQALSLHGNIRPEGDPRALTEASLDDHQWQDHPALREPGGGAHRANDMSAGYIDDPRVLRELSMRFRGIRTMWFDRQANKWILRKADGFEKRQAYLYRLLDHYLRMDRLKGTTKKQMQEIFGPPERAYVRHWDTSNPLFYDVMEWPVGQRDTFLVSFDNGRVVSAGVIMGY